MCLRVELVNFGEQGVDVPPFLDTQDQVPSRPEVNEIESSINEFPNILPQGTTTGRPILGARPGQELPSISNLATTAPPPSPFLDDPPGVVPGTNIG